MSARSVEFRRSRWRAARRLSPLLVVGLLGVAAPISEVRAEGESVPDASLDLTTGYGAAIATEPSISGADVVELSNSALREAVARIEAESATSTANGAAGSLLVEVHSTLGTAALTEIVERHAGTVNGAIDGVLVQARIPADQLEALEAQPEVDYIDTPGRVNIPQDPDQELTEYTGVPPRLDIGPRLGEHVGVTGANAWHTAGITGKGVKVGIIDGFGTAWATSQAAGEIPAPAGVICRSSGTNCDADILKGNIDHGVSVAEVVADMAPGAILYLGQADTPADLQAVVDYFIAQGVRIITRSQSALYDGDGAGTGAVDTVVDNAVKAGITWFNSSGNSAGDTNDPNKRGSYWRGTWADADNDNYLDFKPGIELMEYGCNSLFLGLRWSDWADNKTDYDLLVFTDAFSGFPQQLPNQFNGLNRQQAGSPPIERPNYPTQANPCIQGARYWVAIGRWLPGNGSAGETLEIMLNNGFLEFWSNPSSGTQPASDSKSPGALSIGAMGSGPNDDPFGITNVYYSSQGPTNDNRIKPDMAATSCVNTLAAANAGHPCFNGTSAATPVAAGAAALVLGAGLAGTPAQLKTYMQAAVVDRGTAGPDNIFGTGQLLLPKPPGFNPVSPDRVFDTRPGESPNALRSVVKTKIVGNNTLEVKVTDLPGVPATGVAAVSLNVVVTNTEAAGFVTVYPCGERKVVSSVNYGAGQTVANAVIAPVSPTGTVCLYSPAAVDVLADINGWFPSGDFTPVPPDRIFDTRPGESPSALRAVAKTKVGAAYTLEVKVTDLPGVVPATGVAAVSLNVVATNTEGNGFLTVYPCGTRKEVSSVNYTAGSTVANAVIAPVSPNGTICLYSNSLVDVLADINGWFAGGGFAPVSPSRVFDTRPGAGADALRVVNKAKVSGATVLEVKMTDLPGGLVPASGVAAVSLNVVVTNPDGGGFLTVYPCGTRKEVSSVNFGPGQTVANAVIAPVSNGGGVCFYSPVPVDVIVDINGWFRGAS